MSRFVCLDVVCGAYLVFLILFCANISPSSCDVEPVDPKLLCSREYCGGQTCSPVPEHCAVNNVTHSGKNMMDPSFCNCCEYCLVYLLEGDGCSQGGLGTPPTGNVCGPGLSCQSADQSSAATCQRMKSDCHSAQDLYDENRQNGTLGAAEQRPECDEEGFYAPRICIPGQTCYCQNSKGERIHGEVLNQNNVGAKMMCKCSRVADQTKQFFNEITGSMRCNFDGTYDPLQCVGTRCFCVDTENGLLSSSEIIDSISQPLSDLPCFDRSIHHSRISYPRPCEEEMSEIKKEITEAETEGYSLLGNPFPNCQPDGWYGRTMTLSDKKICVDERGDQIEQYEASLSSDAAKDMDCKCARTQHIMKQSNGITFLPTCCPNGNWKKVQCTSGSCYCVDSNGIQQGLEVDSNMINTLPCSAAPC